MASTTRAIRTIASLKRLQNTDVGQPRFRVQFTDGSVAQTVDNSAIASVLDTSEYREVPLLITFNRFGRISGAKPIVWGFNYPHAEVSRVLAEDPAPDFYRIKITGDKAETRWMNVNREDLDAIRTLLAARFAQTDSAV